MDRRQYLSLAGTTLIASFAGCSSSSNAAEAPDTTSETDTSETQPTTESGPETVRAAVGDHIDADRLSLVIEDVQRGQSVDEQTDSDPGNEFAAVSLALKNTSSDYTTVGDLLQARLHAGDDTQYEPIAAIGDGATFTSGQCAPGEVKRGGVRFEIPTDASTLDLEFDFDTDRVGGIDRATVDLQSTATDVHHLEQDLQIDTYDPGAGVEQDGVEVVVNEFRRESTIGQFMDASSGMEFVVADISVTNQTGEATQVAPLFQMVLKDSDGYAYQDDLVATSQLEDAFDKATPLSDGETRQGTIAYQVEAGLSPLYWAFDFSLLGAGEKTFWALQ